MGSGVEGSSGLIVAGCGLQSTLGPPGDGDVQEGGLGGGARHRGAHHHPQRGIRRSRQGRVSLRTAERRRERGRRLWLWLAPRGDGGALRRERVRGAIRLGLSVAHLLPVLEPPEDKTPPAPSDRC